MNPVNSENHEEELCTKIGSINLQQKLNEPQTTLQTEVSNRTTNGHLSRGYKNAESPSSEVDVCSFFLF